MNVLSLHQIHHVEGDDKNFPERKDNRWEDARDYRGINLGIIRAIPVQNRPAINYIVSFAHLTHTRHRCREHAGREDHQSYDEGPDSERSGTVVRRVL